MLFLFICLLGASTLGVRGWDAERVENEIKPSVVSIRKESEIAFEGNKVGEFLATGFVVDADLGIVATNKHVSGTSPSYYQVGLFDGTSLDAELVWYDPIEDYAFLKILQDQKKNKALKAVRFADGEEPVQAGDNVLLVGNNEGRDFSVKEGQIASLRRGSSSSRNLFWQTTLDRTGGASGSPIFNDAFEVIAIHAAGTDTTSMEVPIALLKRSLDALRAQLNDAPSKPLVIPRGDFGARFDLESVGNAARYFGMTVDVAKTEIARQMNEAAHLRTGSPPCVPVLSSIVPDLPADGILQAGDVILKANGESVGCNLAKLAHILDIVASESSASSSVRVDILRGGQLMSLDVPVVDANTNKIVDAVQVAGGVFHDVTPAIRLYFVGENQGVWLSYAAPGSPLETVGETERDEPGYTDVLVTAVNGKSVTNIDDLVRLLKPVLMSESSSKDAFLSVIDYKTDELVSRAATVSFQSSHVNSVWTYDAGVRRWSKTPLFQEEDRASDEVSSEQDSEGEADDGQDADSDADDSDILGGGATGIEEVTHDDDDDDLLSGMTGAMDGADDDDRIGDVAEVSANDASDEDETDASATNLDDATPRSESTSTIDVGHTPLLVSSYSATTHQQHIDVRKKKATSFRST